MFDRLLELLARTFDRAALPYMIIGGQAVLVYGEPRLTRDVDVTLGVDVDRLEDVLGCVRTMGLRPLVDPERFTRETMVLPCEDPTTGIRVDLVFSFSPYEQVALSRVRAVRVGDTDVKFASPEDLVVHKLVAGRPRDLEDVAGVLGKMPDLDLTYVRDWLGQFEAMLERPLLATFERLALAV